MRVTGRLEGEIDHVQSILETRSMTATGQKGTASVTIRSLDRQLKSRLRVRAAQHGRSMEEEAREILRTVLAEGPAQLVVDLPAPLCR